MVKITEILWLSHHPYASGGLKKRAPLGITFNTSTPFSVLCFFTFVAMMKCFKHIDEAALLNHNVCTGQIGAIMKLKNYVALKLAVQVNIVEEAVMCLTSKNSKTVAIIFHV
mmetsp:Transcript_28211/g.41958  ORF Transcript_28211/g.41958 Transcript_28211/m.41958 type:complete len:112 (+) Transcript_28211:5626-5961(+)